MHFFEIATINTQSYLQCPKRCGLEPIVELTKSLSDFSDKPLERETLNQKLCGFLIAADFSESDRTRAEAPAFDIGSYIRGNRTNISVVEMGQKTYLCL